MAASSQGGASQSAEGSRSARRFPVPSERQGRVLWVTVTALAIAIFVVLVGLVLMGLAWAFNQLAVVIIPLAVATILAYLLDPIVDWLENSTSPYRVLQFSRLKAIVWVFTGIALIIGGIAGTIVPQLVSEAVEFGSQARSNVMEMTDHTIKWVEQSAWLTEVWDENTRMLAREWVAKQMPAIATWVGRGAKEVAVIPNYLLGMSLVPVFAFFFLLQKRPIVESWRDYLPIQDPGWKREIVFVLRSINDSMIAFFRGQVLVAMCLGIMLTVGYLILGLKYAILLGVVAAVLSIIPYLGVILGIIPALLIAVIKHEESWVEGWWLPLLVLVLFVAAQTAEGLFISPKIIGDRVGMHPMTIIIAVLVGTSLMGGIVGGVLAIPLTAALRAVMFRYVWTKQESEPSRGRSRERQGQRRRSPRRRSSKKRAQ